MRLENISDILFCLNNEVDVVYSPIDWNDWTILDYDGSHLEIDLWENKYYCDAPIALMIGDRATVVESYQRMQGMSISEMLAYSDDWDRDLCFEADEYCGFVKKESDRAFFHVRMGPYNSGYFLGIWEVEDVSAK